MPDRGRYPVGSRDRHPSRPWQGCELWGLFGLHSGLFRLQETHEFMKCKQARITRFPGVRGPEHAAGVESSLPCVSTAWPGPVDGVSRFRSCAQILQNPKETAKEPRKMQCVVHIQSVLFPVIRHPLLSSQINTRKRRKRIEERRNGSRLP